MALPEPAVPASAYDDHYYREVCCGSEEWAASDGERFGGLYEGYANLLDLRPGEVLVDVGCGRGELLAVAASRGALGIGVAGFPNFFTITGPSSPSNTKEPPSTASMSEMACSPCRSLI